MSISLLTEAIKQGDQDKLSLLLKEDPSLAAAQTEQGISVLLFAAYCRNQGAVAALRSLRSSLDFYEAAALGDLAIVVRQLNTSPTLLQAFAPDGFTALGLATFFAQAPIVEALIRAGANVNQAANNSFKVAPLHSAVAAGHLEVTTMLLASGADPNLAQQQGVRALHSAAKQGRADLVKVLLGYGADVTLVMDDGTSALDFAKEQQVIDLLQSPTT